MFSHCFQPTCFISSREEVPRCLHHIYFWSNDNLCLYSYKLHFR